MCVCDCVGVWLFMCLSDGLRERVWVGGWVGGCAPVRDCASRTAYRGRRVSARVYLCERERERESGERGERERERRGREANREDESSDGGDGDAEGVVQAHLCVRVCVVCEREGGEGKRGRERELRTSGERKFGLDRQRENRLSKMRREREGEREEGVGEGEGGPARDLNREWRGREERRKRGRGRE